MNNKTIIIIVITILIIIIALSIVGNYFLSKPSKNNEIYPYKKTKFLTNNEYRFYKNLFDFANIHNFSILMKIRLADIIEVDKSIIDSNDYMKYFAKIKSKHIDFALINKDTVEIITLIELDDYTHQRQKRVERDIFVDNALRNANINIIHCLSIEDFKTKFNNLITINNEVKN